MGGNKLLSEEAAWARMAGALDAETETAISAALLATREGGADETATGSDGAGDNLGGNAASAPSEANDAELLSA